MNKTVLITGANKGIGLGFVKEYLCQHYNVIATCRTPEYASELINLNKIYAKNLIVEKLDVINKKDFEHLATKYKLNSFDILINNAGIFPENHSKLGLEAANVKDIVDAFQTNAVGAFQAIQSFLPNLLKSQNPKVINISSQMGSMNSANGFGYSYRMSKVALNMLTKCFAAENDQIITIALRPGWVKTQMGGENAIISIEESIMKMVKIIDGLTINDSGKFFDNEKESCEW